MSMLIHFDNVLPSSDALAIYHDIEDIWMASFRIRMAVMVRDTNDREMYNRNQHALPRSFSLCVWIY